MLQTLQKCSVGFSEIAYIDSSYHYLQLFYWSLSPENLSSPIFEAILGQFLAKSCDFQIPIFRNWVISMVWVQCLNEVFLVFFHLNAAGFPENFSILRFGLSKVIGTRPPQISIFSVFSQCSSFSSSLSRSNGRFR